MISELIVIEKKRAQIMGGSQPLQIGYVPGDGGQICQGEQVLTGQWPAGLLQFLANGGVQAGVGNGHLLCPDCSHEIGKNQQQRTQQPENACAWHNTRIKRLAFPANHSQLILFFHLHWRHNSYYCSRQLHFFHLSIAW